MPAHRMCSTPGCGGPAVYGSICFACATDPEGRNVLIFGCATVPFRRPAHVPAGDFQGAIDRALNR